MNPSDSENGPQGTGGWIMVFIFHMYLCLGITILSLFEGREAYEELWRFGESWRMIRPHLVLLEGMELFAVVVIPVGLILLFRHSPATPRCWQFVMAILSLGALLNAMACTEILKEITPFLGDYRGLEEYGRAIRSTQVGSIGGMVVGMSWFFYWSWSKRVENTFKPIEDVDEREASFYAKPAHVVDPDPFRDRPTMSCPHCSNTVLATAEYCRGCRKSLVKEMPGDDHPDRQWMRKDSSTEPV